MALITCPVCLKQADKPTGYVNRAARGGLRIFCGRACSGLGRRINKPKEQKVQEKRQYDMLYRHKNLYLLKTKKHEYFKRTYDPVKAAIERKSTMTRHIQYCRQPNYRKYKKGYDQTYRAKRSYGVFWESAVALLNIEQEVGQRISRYEIYLQNGTLNKWHNRRREYEKLISQ